MTRYRLVCGRKAWPVRASVDEAKDDALIAGLASQDEWGARRIYISVPARIEVLR